jgi:RHS repeat-associated protein
VTIRADAKEGGQVFSRSAQVNIIVQAATGVTGVKGRFVTPDNQGIAGIIVRADIAAQPQTVSDAAGNFLLTGLPAGQVSLKMDATPANPLYPIWPYLATLAANQINLLPDWTISPPPTADKFVTIANAAQDQVITDARFPGLAITLPAGVTITGYDGVVKSRIAVERIMPDKLPVSSPPFPMREAYQLYFGTPMGGIPSAPIPVTLPNVGEFEPGDQAEIWYFDGSPMGGTGQWKLAGLGTVSDDGRTVASNAGVGIPRFCGVCGLMSLSCPPPPVPPQPPPRPCPTCGKPIDLFTGQELMSMDLMSLSGLTPIDLWMNYNPVDAFNGRAGTVASFGFGWVSNYDTVFLPFNGPQKRLVMPGSRFVNFLNDGTGTYKPFDDPSFDGATIRLLDATLNQWELKFRDGRIWRFLPFAAITGKIIGGAPTFVSEMVDTAGNTLSITRQSNGRINSIGSPERNVIMSYGTNGFVSDVKDTANRAMHFTYTPTNRLATVTDADGKVARYTYVDDTEITPDPACSPQPTMGERIKTVLFPGKTTPTENFYGSSRRILRQLRQDGREFKVAYKVTGACVTRVSNPGVVCQIGCPEIDSWDNFQAGWRFHGGRIVGVTVANPNGSTYGYGFNAKGTTSGSTDTQGQLTKNKYDSANRLIERTDALGRTWKYEYDDRGNITQTVDPLGRNVNYAYDGKWNKVTNIVHFLPDNTPVVMQFTYDTSTGKLTRAIDPLGNVRTFTYTTRGQPAGVTEPQGRTSTFGYNLAGDLVSTSDPLGNEQRFATDGSGRPTVTTDALGYTTTLEYNGVNDVTGVTDALTHTMRKSYDAAGRLSTVVNTLHNVVESYQYDAGDRITQRSDALNRSVLYNYDSFGRLAGMTDRKGQATSFSYDSQNRLVSTQYADGSAQALVFDMVGRLVEVREPDNVITYDYDNVDRVTRVVTETTAVRSEIGYQYDTLSRIVTRTINGGDATTYTYDNANRPLTITYRGQTTTYLWDSTGRLAGKTLPDGIAQKVIYDDADRIIQLLYLRPDTSVIETIAYTYDANGQRTSKSSSNSSVQETPFAATYDAANRMTSLTLTGTGQTFDLTYDNNGNLLTKTSRDNPNNVTSYTWDSRNRLIQMLSPGLTAKFQYDAFGRRVAKTVNGQTIGYLYEGMQAIGEVTGGSISATLLTTLRIDDVIARYTDSGHRTYLTDALGSVFAVAKEDQSIQAFYAYTPYGEGRVLGDDEGNSLQYSARENDQTGLYFYRARYYDPILKRFISEDPIGLAGGDNVYAYSDASPVNLNDPLGLWPSCISRIVSVTDKQWEDPDEIVLDHGYGIGARNIHGGFGGHTPGKHPPIGPEIRFELWTYEWTKYLLKIYLNHEMWQNLLYICDEDRTDECGRTTHYHFEWNDSKMTLKTRTFLRNEITETRNWIKKLVDIILLL